MRLALALMVTVAAVVLVASSAGAGSGFQTSVRILDDASGDPPKMHRNYFPHFTGKVSSPKDACKNDRLVKLFLQPKSGDPTLQGKTHSEPNGNWEIVLNKPGEHDFFAKARPRELGSGTCRGDRSPLFHHNPFD